MVMVCVPVAARLPTVTVIVEFPPPVIEDGLKLTLFALPSPEAVRLTAPLKPPEIDTVMVEVPELLRATVSDVGEALSEKPACVPITVSDTVVVSTVLPDVPVTVMG